MSVRMKSTLLKPTRKLRQFPLKLATSFKKRADDQKVVFRCTARGPALVEVINEEPHLLLAFEIRRDGIAKGV